MNSLLALVVASTVASVGFGGATVTADAATISFVRQITNSAGATSSLRVLISVTNPGDTLILNAGIYDGYGTPIIVRSVTDNNGGIWMKAASTVYAGADSEIWYAADHSAGTTTVTIAMSGRADIGANLSEFSGIVSDGSVDVANSAFSGSTVVNPGSIQTANAYDLLVAAGRYSGIARVSSGPANAFNPMSTAAGGNGTTVGAYRIAALTGSYSTSWSVSSGVAWSGVIVAFKGGVMPADAVPPTMPTGLSIRTGSSAELDLTWRPSTDNVAVTGYDIYRDGILAGTSSIAAYVDYPLPAGTMHTYTVSAFDPARNVSARSASITGATAATPGGTGASINETAVARTYHVDLLGNDSDSGTVGAPFKTINKAIGLAAANVMIGAKIIIDPGRYPETLDLRAWSSKRATAPLILQAAIPGQTVIDGADVWSDWISAGDGVFTHSWPYNWGYADPPAGWSDKYGNTLPSPSQCPSNPECILLRREMVFVNGVALTQRLSGPLDTPGTFRVVDGRAIYIYPPSGTNMTVATVRIAVRNQLLDTPNGIQNLVVRGLVFTHDNTAINNSGYGAVSIHGSDSKNILFDDDQFVWNNWQGLNLQGPVYNVTIKDSIARHTGENGVNIYKIKNLLFEGDDVSYNNWRGYAANFVGYDADGMKALRLHSATFSNSKFDNNQTGGIWLDTDDKDVVFKNSDFSKNLTNGIFIEASQGPLWLEGNSFCSNRKSGILAANSPYITINATNVTSHNGVFGILVGGDDAMRTFIDWESGWQFSLYSHNWTISGNDISATSTQNGAALGSQLSSAWPRFTSTLSSDNNTWYIANGEQFLVPGAYLTLAQWREKTGQDMHSTNAQPTVPCAPSNQRRHVQ